MNRKNCMIVFVIFSLFIAMGSLGIQVFQVVWAKGNDGIFMADYNRIGEHNLELIVIPGGFLFVVITLLVFFSYVKNDL